MKNIGDTIKEGLQRRRMTGAELSRIMGVGSSTVSGWISGKIIPPGDKLIKIAQVLDIAEELFSGTIENNFVEDEHTKRFIREMIIDTELRLENKLDKKLQDIVQQIKQEIKEELSEIKEQKQQQH